MIPITYLHAFDDPIADSGIETLSSSRVRQRGGTGTTLDDGTGPHHPGGIDPVPGGGDPFTAFWAWSA